MRKRRYLRKEISYALAGINAVILIALASIDDLKISAIPWIIGAMAVFAANAVILYRWGRIEDFIDEEEDEAL